MNSMEQARFNMIEQQIRPWDVADPQVLGLLSIVKREQFVPAGRQSLAFMDMEIPLGYGAAMWQPKLEARVLHELHVQKSECVLEVGTGSGYLTALLSRLAAQVASIEIVPALSSQAAHNLAGQCRGREWIVVLVMFPCWKMTILRFDTTDQRRSSEF